MLKYLTIPTVVMEYATKRVAGEFRTSGHDSFFISATVH